MSKSYNEIMEKIEATDEMKDRILKNIESVDFSQSSARRRSKLYKYLSLAACLLIFAVTAITLPKINKTPDIEQNVSSAVSDITECSSAEELSKKLGFDVYNINSLPFEPEKVYYTAYWGYMAQIEYINGDSSILYRKSLENEDNSGDYNNYDTITEVASGDITYTLKGYSDKYRLSLWQNGDFSYSISFSDGISEEEMLSILESIK